MNFSLVVPEYVVCASEAGEKRLNIYIAGPYSSGVVLDNVHNAILAAEQITAKGHVPFVPHLTYYWERMYPHPYEFWLEQDMKWLERCDALLRLHGESHGADAEVLYAEGLGLLIFNSIDEIPSIK